MTRKPPPPPPIKPTATTEIDFSKVLLELGKEFEESGFAVEDFMGDVGGSAFDPESTEFAVIAQKPDSA